MNDREIPTDDQDREVWDRAVSTLSSMCVAEMMGNGCSKRAFIATLRLYANEMEKLLQKKPDRP